MAADPATVLDLPKPRWATDDVSMLYDMATRFLSEEIAPRYQVSGQARLVVVGA